jgi:hypothetical protein
LGETRIFTTEEFDEFASKQRLDDATLVRAIKDIEKGLVDADLGGNVVKQRIARPGGGKSGGYRSVVIFRRGDRAVFVEGYPKNEKSNLTPQELRAFKAMAKWILELTDGELADSVVKGVLREINRND